MASKVRDIQETVQHEIHGRPHERTLERMAFDTWIKVFGSENAVSPAASVWFKRRFADELDRRRGLERTWRRTFWLTRYVILSGALVLPVLITAAKSITWLSLAAIIVSIVVALATAVESLLRSGQKWRLYRQGADKMSSEGAAFFQGLGVYAQADPLERFHIFQKRTELEIENFHKEYVAEIEVTASRNTANSGSK